jgi:redox-sensitive bicupin YhaK (pirin superfamily)
VYTRTPVHYLDFKLESNAAFTQPIPSDWNAFVFVLDGEGAFGDDEQKGIAHHTLILSQGDSLKFSNKSKSRLHFVLIAGKPLNEPIVQHGPFVMNTREEIEQTFNDYRNAKNGFENVRTWKSGSDD